MQRKWRLIVALGIIGAATSAGATTVYMQRLPVSVTNGCLNCHVVGNPSAVNATLNVFGVDFRTNAFKWDRTLALMNSDRDACTNGFELGDRDGDGRPDAGVIGEHSNPGQSSDCTLELTPAAWSALKNLFR